MPLTPFIGLSVLVHICIILIFKIVNRPMLVKNADPRLTTPAVFWSGCLIIFVVFTFVITTAVVLVRGSLIERHSSVRFVADHVDFRSLSAEAFDYISTKSWTGVYAMTTYLTESPGNYGHNNTQIAMESPIPKNTIEPEENEKAEEPDPRICDEIYYERALSYNNSLVGYLVVRGFDRSFEYRSELALEAGIPNYTGNSEQNWLLMNFLFNKFGEFNDTPCRF